MHLEQSHGTDCVLIAFLRAAKTQRSRILHYTGMKKQNTEKKKIALWLDHQEAYFIKIKKKKVSIKTIQLGRESQGSVNEEGAKENKVNKSPSSNQESKTHKSEQNLKAKYFTKLTSGIAKADTVYLFGPTTAKEELLRYLLEATPPQKRTFIVDSTDSLTFPQMIARAKAVLGE